LDVEGPLRLCDRLVEAPELLQRRSEPRRIERRQRIELHAALPFGDGFSLSTEDAQVLRIGDVRIGEVPVDRQRIAEAFLGAAVVPFLRELRRLKPST
jgi:hypothetical protein